MADEVTGPSPRGGPEDLKPSEKKFVDEKLTAHNEEDRLVMRLTFLKGKKRKREERLLVIGTYRLYVFKGTKCTDELHLLDLEEICIPAENEICFKFKGDITLSFVTRNIDELIQRTTKSFNKCFPTVPEEYQFKVLRDKEPMKIKRSATMNIGSCGGFVKTYKAVCDYLGLPVRQDMCWDVENILLFGNIHEFNMMDYFYGKDTVTLSELKPLTTSLEHNVWFTSFISSHKIGAEGVQCVAPMVQFNSRFESLILKQTGCNKPQVWEAFGEALLKNKYLAISTLDLSGNPIEDAGMVKIASAIQQWRCPLRYLDVSNTGLSKHGIGNILASIAGNQNVYTTLEYLNVGDNKGIVDADVTKALTDLMNKTKNLKTLVLKNTQLTGWTDIRLCSSLTSLDISGNKIMEGEGYSVAAAIAPASMNLKLLNLSNTMASATIINQVAATCTAVQSLNLADNELGDDGLIAVCECLKQNKNLKELSLDRNWVHKSKNRQRAIDSLISLVTAQANNTPSIKILLMAGSVKNKSQLKEEIRPFILALMGDTSLETLDVSGQGMADVGALALSKTLQTDPNLRRVVVDENGISIVGFKVLVNSLERNFHLSSLPIPIADIMKIIANNSEKQRDVSQLLEQLEYKLRTNEQRLSEDEMADEVETEPSSLDDSDGSMTARARKTRSQSYFPRLKPMSGPNSNSSTSGEYPSLRPDPRREQRRRPSEKQLNKGSLNPRMLAQQSASHNNSPNGRDREVNTMRDRETRSNTLGGDSDRPAVPTLKLDGAATLPVGPLSDRNLLRQPSNDDLTTNKVVQTARESTKDRSEIKKEVKIDRETLRKEKERKKKEEESKQVAAPQPQPQDKESPRQLVKDTDSDKSNKSDKKRESDSSSKKAHSDKDSDKGNTTPREEKPLAKSEPAAIASPSLEQPKSKARHTHIKSELPVRPKPSAASAKRRREFDTATALTLFGDMEKVLEAPPSENAEVNDLKALLGDADIKLNL